MSVPGIILLAFIVIFIFIFNSLIMKRNLVDNMLAIITAHLKNRAGMILKLLEAAGGEVPESADTLKALAEEYTSSAAVSRKCDLDCRTTALLNTVVKQMQNQSDLPETEEVKTLLESLKENAELLANARLSYNKIVQDFNHAITVAPGKFFGRLMRLSPRELWEIPAQTENNC